MDRLEARVAAHRDESWHVKRASQVFAPALNERPSLPVTGLARHGWQTGETGQMFATDGSDLGHSLPGSDLHGKS